MEFLDKSETMFQTNLSTSDRLDKFLINGIQRSYTLDSDQITTRSLTIPESYRNQNIPLPSLDSSFQLDERIIAENNLISPAAVFDNTDELEIAEAERQNQKDQPSTLLKHTYSYTAKRRPTRVRSPK